MKYSILLLPFLPLTALADTLTVPPDLSNSGNGVNVAGYKFDDPAIDRLEMTAGSITADNVNNGDAYGIWMSNAGPANQQVEISGGSLTVNDQNRGGSTLIYMSRADSSVVITDGDFEEFVIPVDSGDDERRFYCLSVEKHWSRVHEEPSS